MITAVQNTYEALKYASKEQLKNKEIITTAIENNSLAIE